MTAMGQARDVLASVSRGLFLPLEMGREWEWEWALIVWAHRGAGTRLAAAPMANAYVSLLPARHLCAPAKADAPVSCRKSVRDKPVSPQVVKGGPEENTRMEQGQPSCGVLHDAA